MARDYQARRIVLERAALCNDPRLTQALVRAFDLICNNEEPDGCLSTSVALHVILRSFGYDPKLCYGLCAGPEGQHFYHAWIWLDGKVLDLAIYGNSHFSPFWHEAPLFPVVFEEYCNTAVRYGDHVFDSDWENCQIAQFVRLGSIGAYIAKAPRVKHPSGNGLWRVIFNILKEPYSRTRQEELAKSIDYSRLE